MNVEEVKVYIYNNDLFADDYGELADGKKVIFESYPLVVVEGFIKNEYSDKLFIELQILGEKETLKYSSMKEAEVKSDGEIYVKFRLEEKIHDSTHGIVTFHMGREKMKKVVRLPEQHRLYGKVLNFEGRPVQAYIVINSFKFRGVGFAKTDADGFFEIMLPERRYQQIFICDENYGRSKLEFYGWNLYLDKDTELIARFDKIEIFRMAVGVTPERTVIVDFVPMDIFHTVQRINQDLKQKVDVDYSSSKYYPKLSTGDIEVFIDDSKAELWTLHKRKHSLADYGLDKKRQAYTLEAKIPSQIRAGKHTLKVLIHKEIDENGRTLEEWGESIYFDLHIWT
jgi:hypothetical protein